jgi:ADP-heptose:LPS heptosyltransferase/glycosyltransferase involved in cell wall biosynthesis
MKTIGLCMIVKDEAHVILRCLESVRPLVDYVLVVDTGSTDGTQQIVWDYLMRENLAGGVVEEPWRNFAYNRTFALQELRKAPQVDYALIIDADDQLELDAGFDPKTFKAGMDQDLYDVEVSHGNMTHFRPHLFRNDLPFSFKGVVHEYLEAPPGDLSRGRAAGFRIKISGGGARSRNTRKFEDDAALLERALATETDPFLISRYTFYLAQSYRDCGEKEKALENYLKRAELGYWAEEIYVSLFEAGNMMAALDRPFDEVIATYLRASDVVPTRVEALHAASRYCRDHGKNAQGYEIARPGIDLPQPAGALFAQPWVYDYGLLDEFAVNAYWAGAYRESLDASLRLLGSERLPGSMRVRVAANARFAADKLAPTVANIGHDARDPQPSSTETAGAAADVKPTFACCPVCGAIETTKPRPDLEPHPYVACCRCGLFYQPHMHPKVFEGHHETRGDLMSEADRQANRQLAAAFYYNHLAKKFKDRELFHLDIGSKYPFFGHCLQAVARESGTPLTSHGVDGIPEAREFGRRLGVLMAVGDFEADPQTWDVSPEMRERVALGGFHCVSLIHCLEHFYNPLQTLRNIRRLMVEGGILFVRAPDSQAPRIEGDLTTGHYSIHPTICCEQAMYEALAKLQGAFAVYETYELGHQRDYLLQAIERKPTIGVGLAAQDDDGEVRSAIESVAAVADRFSVRHTGLPHSMAESLEKWVGDRLDVAPCQQARAQTDEGRQAEDMASARNQYVEALDQSVDWVLRLDPAETVPPDTCDIIRRAPYMLFDCHRFQIRAGGEAYPQSRLWRTKRGVRYVGATKEDPTCPADFRVRDWNCEIVHSGVSRAAAVLENYRTLKANAESTEAGGQRMFEFAKACRDAYGVTNEKHYLEEEISAFERCLDGDPSYASDAYRSMAASYADLGRDWEAAAAARKALEYAPHDQAFRTWMRERTPRVINILRPGAIGDVLVSSAVTALLAARNPDIEIHYYTKVPGMAKLLVGVHKVCDADEWAKRERGADFTLIGYPIGEGYPEQPMRKHLTGYFCDEARLPPGLPQLKEEELEPFEIGGRWITIHPKSGWSVYKDWSLDKWNEIVRRIHRDYPEIAIVLIGGADDPALDGIDSDLRGRTSLSQSLWLIKHSALHLGCDSFSNHAAGAFGHPAVIVFGSTSPTGSGYASAINLWAGLDCSPCYREDPRISRQSRGPCINPSGQDYERPRHACMAVIGVEMVWEAIDSLLAVGTAARGDGVPIDQAREPLLVRGG